MQNNYTKLTLSSLVNKFLKIFYIRLAIFLFISFKHFFLKIAIFLFILFKHFLNIFLLKIVK
jgi:hypothetical protein